MLQAGCSGGGGSAHQNQQLKTTSSVLSFAETDDDSTWLIRQLLFLSLVPPYTWRPVPHTIPGPEAGNHSYLTDCPPSSCSPLSPRCCSLTVTHILIQIHQGTTTEKPEQAAQAPTDSSNQLWRTYAVRHSYLTRMVEIQTSPVRSLSIRIYPGVMV